MKFRTIFLAMAVVGSLAGPAAANDLTDEVTTALVSEGYAISEVSRTWLGRVRIVAVSDEVRREIVINPYTGEVLRDYSVLLVARDSRLEPRDNLFTDVSPGVANDDAARASSVDIASDPALSGTESVVAPVVPPGE